MFGNHDAVTLNLFDINSNRDKILLEEFGNLWSEWLN